MESSEIVLDLDALMRASRVRVHGLGEVQLDPDRRALRVEVGRHMPRPFAINYRAFANRAIGVSLQPSQPETVVGALPDADRRRLMAKLADMKGQYKAWKALHGSGLSWDERFFAVMLWALRRERADARGARRLAQGALPSASKYGLTVLTPWAGLSQTFEATKGVSKLMEGILGARSAFELAGVHEGYADVTQAATGLSFGQHLAAPAFAGMLSPTSPVFDATAFNPNFLNSIEGAQNLSKSVAEQHLFAGIDPALLERPYLGIKSPLAGAGIERALAAVDAAASWSSLTDLYAKPDGPLTHLQLIEQMTRGALGANLAGRDILGLDPRRWWIDLVPPWVFPPPDPFEEQFAAQWENDPLWFLVGELAVTAIRPLLSLSRATFLDIMFDALEAAVRAGKLTTWLCAAVASAPYLTDEQRHQLDRGLCEAAAGDWVIAPVLLLVGLEGAISMTPPAQQAMASSRTFLAAEKLVKHLGLDPTHDKFLRTRVYGGGGNKIRHGRENAAHREQTLLAVVALAGWLDAQANARAMERVASALSSGLRGRGAALGE